VSDREFWHRIVPQIMDKHREWQEQEADRQGREILLELEAYCLAAFPGRNGTPEYNGLPDATKDILRGLGK
jgi:hypothetical protein